MSTDVDHIDKNAIVSSLEDLVTFVPWKSSQNNLMNVFPNSFDNTSSANAINGQIYKNQSDCDLNDLSYIPLIGFKATFSVPASFRSQVNLFYGVCSSGGPVKVNSNELKSFT